MDPVVTEETIRSNIPVDLYRVAIDGKSHPVRASILVADAADEWCAGAANEVQNRANVANWIKKQLEDPKDLEAMTKLHSDLLDAKKAYVGAVRAALRAYDPSVFTEAVIGASTNPQIMGAFELLYEVTDPIEAGHSFNLARMNALVEARRTETSS